MYTPGTSTITSTASTAYFRIGHTLTVHDGWYMLSVVCDATLISELRAFNWKPPKVDYYWPVVQYPKPKTRHYTYRKSSNKMSYQQRRQNKRRMFCQNLKARHVSLS